MNKLTHPIEPEELMAYLDGELAGEKASVVTAHLSDCEECRQVSSELQGVSGKMKSWPVETPDLTIQLAIDAALDQRTPEPTKVTRNWKWAWRERFGVRWQAAEYAGLLALVLAVVVGTVRFIGGRGSVNQEFTQVGSLMSDEPTPGAAGDYSSLRTYGNAAPASTPTQTKQLDRLEQFAKLSKAAPVKFKPQKPDQEAVSREPLANGPMVIRTADLALITKDFDNARSNVEAILKRHRGYIGELKVGGSTGSGRGLTATLRVPADQLDATINDLKTLGRVETESQSGQDVTSQYVDLQARLSNARNTEQRLTDLLRQRTGKLSDVLEVEQEVARVRGEIEQMEAERKTMSNQVSYATLNVSIAEDYKAQLQVVPPSTWTRLSNAAVAGYKNMVDGMVGLALFVLENIPSLLFWAALLFLPARLVWKKARRFARPSL